MQHHGWSAAFLLATCTALAAPLCADRLVTKDGRILTPKKAREEGAGYRLVFENGEIVLPDRKLVASVEIEGDMSDYQPQNDDEKKKLADGYVKYHGKWMSKPAYAEVLRKEHELSKERTDLIAAHSQWSSALVKETAHFTVKTDTSPELLDYYCELLEAYYNLMDARIGINPSLDMRRAKLAVNIYKSREEFHELAPYPDGKMPFGVAGFFYPDWREPKKSNLNFYHDYADTSISNWVSLHECTHLLTYLIDQSYIAQIWLNEGVADYFGSSKITRDKKGKLVIEPGELQTDRVLTVQQAIAVGNDEAPATGDKPESGEKKKVKQASGESYVPLEKLFLLSRDEFQAFEYAHAWSFVYFLNNFDNGKYAKAFDKFFKALYTTEKGIKYEVIAAGSTGAGKQVSPENIREYLLKRLGVKDTEQLEKDWKTYISGIAIEGPAARLKRGLIAVREFRFDDALDDLDAAIEGGSEDSRAYWARGRARAVMGKPKEGIKDLQKAVEMDPLSAPYRYELSRLMAGRISFASKDDGITDGDGESKKKLKKPEAKVQAGLASELDPDNERLKEWFNQFE